MVAYGNLNVRLLHEVRFHVNRIAFDEYALHRLEWLGPWNLFVDMVEPVDNGAIEFRARTFGLVRR